MGDIAFKFGRGPSRLSSRPKERAVFLDRDGVINEILFHQEMGVLETPFTADQFRLRKGVAGAIRQLNRLGLKIVVVSNQPGVAMRHFTRKTLDRITQKMKRELKRKGSYLDGVLYCLHHPTKGVGSLKKNCACRKPKPGLFYEAARWFNIDLKKSYLVGDSILDVQAGRRAGCTTFLLSHLKCDLCHLMAKRGIKPDYLVKGLAEVVKRIRRLERVSS